MNKVKRSLFNKLKKFSASILALAMLLSNVAPVYANEYSGKLVVSQIDTQLHYKGSSSKYGILGRRAFYGNYQDLKMIFCVEHGVELPTEAYVGASYTANMPTNLQQATRIAYLGWYSKYGDEIMQSENLADLKYDYAFTQMMIWESQGTGAEFTDSSVQSKYVTFKNQVNAQITERAKLPSFYDQNVELDIGQTVTLTDTNSVLSGFNSCNETVDGIKFEHTKGSNDLKITVTDSCNKEKFTLTPNISKKIGLYKHEGGNDIRYYDFGKDSNGNATQKNIYTNCYPDDPIVSLNMKINLYGSLELTKTNDKDKLVDGSVFRLTGKTNNFTKDITVINGKIKVDEIPKGTYSLTEIKAPTVKNTDGAYKELTGTASEVVINCNDTTYKTVVNAEKNAKINFTKTLGNTKTGLTGDATVEGATYKLTASTDIKNADGDIVLRKGENAVDRTSGNDVAVKKTNKNGNITWSNLWLGNYTISEVEPSTGTLLNTQTITATATSSVANTSNEAVVTKSQPNTVKQQPVEIFKQAIGDDNHSSGVVKGLNGAEFTVKLQSEVNKVGWDNATTYDVVTTKNDEDGASGYATTKSLPYGKYILRETKTPEGYITAPEYVFEITKDSTKNKKIVINNDKVSAYVKIIKKDTKTGKTVKLNGTSFKIKNIETGKYVTQKVGSTTYDVFTTNSKNNVVLDKNYYRSDNDLQGEVVTPLKLITGKYQVEEVGVPSGFLDSEEPVQFKILNEIDLTKDNEGDNVVTVVITNEQPTATLKINKTVTLDDKADLSLVDTNDLSCIEFTLTAKEDVIDMSDGSLIYRKDAVVGKYNLNQDGKLTIDNLPIGKYKLQETKTLDSLVLNDKVYDVTFTQKDTKTKVYTVSKNIENQPTKVKFTKTDVTGDKELVGAKLQIIDKNNKVVAEWTSTDKPYYIEGLAKGSYTLVETLAPDEYVISSNVDFSVDDSGKVHQVKMKDKQVKVSKLTVGGQEVVGALMQILDEEGNIVDEWYSEGKYHFANNLEEGKTYTLHEDLSPIGLNLANDFTFKVTTEKEIQKVEMTDTITEVEKTDVDGKFVKEATLSIVSAKTKEIVDQWVTGQHIIDLDKDIKSQLKENGNVEGTYMDSEDSMVTFSISKNEDRDDYTLMLIKDGVTTYANIDLNGNETTHRVQGLISGEDYILRETKTPEEYVTAKEIQFTAKADKDEKIVMTDKQVTISKATVSGEEVNGALMQILDKDGNVVDEWYSEGKHHYATGLIEGNTYTLHEDLAPAGMNLANDIEFTVTYEKETQKVTMIDNITKVKKVDNEGKLLKDATLQIVSTKTKDIVDQWISGQHIFDITKEMKTALEKDGKIENMYVDKDDATVTYKLTANKDSNDYTLMLIKDGETNYYTVDKDGNETSHMVRGLIEGEEYKLVEVKAPKKYVVANSKTFTTENKDTELELVDKQVTVKKTDLVTGDEVEGAELTVTDKETNEVVDEWVSGKDEHYISGLEEGKTYILTEKTAPNGYYVAESIEFTVTTDKEIQKLEMKDAPILTNIQVNKVDAKTGKLIKSKDFAFTMYEDAECTKEIETVHADKESGTATFKDVRYSTVYIKETKAPLGYLLSDEVKKVVIDDNLENVGKTYSFEYVNTLEPIIKTGDETNVNGLIALGGLSGIVLIASAIAYRKKKSEEN